MKKFNKDGSDTKQWKAHKKRVLAAGGMIGNSPFAYVLAKRAPVPEVKQTPVVWGEP